MKASKLLKFIPLAITKKKPILLQGEPGVGKTDVIMQAVESLGHKIHVRHAVCMEPIDFRGFPTIKRVDGEETSAEFVPYGDLLDMINLRPFLGGHTGGLTMPYLGLAWPY